MRHREKSLEFVEKEMTQFHVDEVAQAACSLIFQGQMISF